MLEELQQLSQSLEARASEKTADLIGHMSLSFLSVDF
jgi:hypothetical protein